MPKPLDPTLVQQVLTLRRDGLLLREIAQQLGMNPTTVRMLCSRHRVKSPVEYRGGTTYHAERVERLKAQHQRNTALQRYWEMP